jgi:hypothetical protein
MIDRLSALRIANLEAIELMVLSLRSIPCSVTSPPSVLTISFPICLKTFGQLLRIPYKDILFYISVEKI